MTIEQESILQPDVVNWYQSALGRTIVDSEIEAIARIIPRQFYRICVQVEGPSNLEYFSHIESLFKCRAATQSASHIDNSVIAQGEYLPFGSSSIDFLILPHVLEFSEFPHDVLREATECMTSSGVLLITGFNPQGLLNLTKRFHRFNGGSIKSNRFHPIYRVREWLALLEFEIFAGEFAFFRPPVNQAYRLKRLAKFEAAGARWWPALGSVYVLASRKRELGIRIKPDFSRYRLRRRRFGLEY